ncbi:MAG TPA: PLDc N-terminal domain-containing protein [Chloroflexota bacterium]|nr:PLDc N-terminal domain-containing protein [Chloroflexota bacterium]
MKILLEILISLFLHPVAMVLMWISLARRSDISTVQKVVWVIVSLLWGLGPILYVLVSDGSLW